MDSDSTVPTISTDALDRYLAGEGTADDVAQVQAWARVHHVEAVLAELRGQAREPEAVRAATARSAADWAIIERKIAESSASNATRATRGGHRAVGDKATKRGPHMAALFEGQTVRRAWMAGAVALFAVVAVLWNRYPTARSFGKTHTYTTTVGQRATLLLDDGTHVMMAPQTTLTLVGFGERSRTVALDGDAYFEVAPSTHAPFIVQTGTTSTRVLGTAFEVRHYTGDADVHVAVATGKVLVSSEGRNDGIPVTAGHVASITDSTRTVQSVDNIDSEIGWLGDQLVFQYVPLPKVLATLTRWYGYKFRSTDSTVLRQNVTIGLSMRSSTEALASLEQILDVSLTVVGDTVTLTPARSRAVPPTRAKHYDVWVPNREVGR